METEKTTGIQDTIAKIVSIIFHPLFIPPSRLKLNTHDTTQVYLGFLTGLAGMSFFMLFF
jgi:hypothetical protein